MARIFRAVENKVRRGGSREAEAQAGSGGLIETDKAERFRELAVPHLDAAYNLARWLTGNAADADDLVQDAFLSAFRFFDQHRGGSAKPWLMKILRNTHFSRLRNARRMLRSTPFEDVAEEAERALSDGREPTHPEAVLLWNEDAETVRSAMRELPADQRAILVLREVEDMSYRDIAEALDIPLGTVMSRLARARKLLANKVTGVDQEAAHGTRRG